MSKFWNIRETAAYLGIMKMFEDTSVPQKVTRERLIDLIDEIDSLIASLKDPRKR